MDVLELTDDQNNTFKYLKYKGRPFSPIIKNNFGDQLHMLETFEYRSDDVFLCLFAKSGTHWIYNILNMLRTGSVKYTADHGILEFNDKYKLESVQYPRTFVTHMTYDILPTAIKSGVGKIVYVIRNPKDVFVSFKYFNEGLKEHIYKGNTDGFLRIFLSDEFCGVGGSWFAHTKEWDDAIKSNTSLRIHTIIYEELQKDTYEEIKKLAKFLEISFNEKLLRNVVDNTTFEVLKTAHATEAGATDKWTYLCKDGRLPVYRKGIIGDWRNELTVSQNALFDTAISEKLSGRSIKIVYK